jgi:MerR family transcriptional regulator, mercuric resistance operon regulatory protein
VTVHRKAEGFMQIGQVSKQSGVTIDTIRFYERTGLLAAPARSTGGFRRFSSEDLASLQFIRNLQELGFSLHEIRELLSLRTNDLRACSEVQKKLQGKLRDIHAKRIALVKLEDELKAALVKCNSQLRHPPKKASARCPVLTALRKNPGGG